MFKTLIKGDFYELFDQKNVRKIIDMQYTA